MGMWNRFEKANCNPPVIDESEARRKPVTNYAILAYMKSPRDYWPRWAEALRRYQLHGFAAMLLEAGAPFALLGAQALYFSRGLIANDQLMALALTLEEDSEARAFAYFLVEEKASS